VITRKKRNLPAPPANRTVLSVVEAAGLLGVGESTLRDMARANKIPHTRFGKRILFKREALMKMLDNEAPPGGAAA
jgi:excisionase family DNA binding protein